MTNPPTLDDSQAASSLHLGDSLATSVICLVALAGVQRLIGLLRNVLFCRLLADGELGRWSLAYSFLLLAAPLVVLGIPGSFGRYAEQYRLQGQLRAFLRRTLTVCLACSAIATIGLGLFPQPLAELLFADPQQVPLVQLLAATLAAVLAFNLLTELLTALRLVRVVSVMQVVSSLIFAALAAVLLFATTWREAAAVAAYGVGMLVSAAIGGYALLTVISTSPVREVKLATGPFWSRLLAFAAWIWFGNLVANLFEGVDQFMLKHCSRVPPAVADALVGQYYSSRVIPLLLVSLAVMLSGCLLPHLVRDWEQGRLAEVQRRLNQAVKLLAVTFTGAAAIILLFAPLLFGSLFGERYELGLKVLPGTLVYCIWYSMACLAQSYLLCAENARRGSLAFVCGLFANVGLNYLWAPRFGLPGVVAATMAANGIALATMFWMSQRMGMRWDRGLIVASGLPLALCLGSWQANVVIALAVWVAWRAEWLFNRAEQSELTAYVGGLLGGARSSLPWSMNTTT